MRVEPHMCRAPVRFGMLATSRIHRSASFFRGFYAMHLPLQAAHPSLLSNKGLRHRDAILVMHRYVVIGVPEGRRLVAVVDLHRTRQDQISLAQPFTYA